MVSATSVWLQTRSLSTPHGIFRFARNDVALILDTASLSRGTMRPSFARILHPEGCGECRVPNAPAASCAKCRKHTSVVTTVAPGSPGIPARSGFNGFLRALPGDRACLPPSPPRSLLLENLTPASGRQDHTTSPSARDARSSMRTRVHRILPRVRDDLEPPLVWGRTVKDVEVICVRREQKYFCREDWTAQITLIPRENFSSRRILEAWAGDHNLVIVVRPYSNAAAACSTSYGNIHPAADIHFPIRRFRSDTSSFSDR